MSYYRIFEIQNGRVKKGATVETFKLKAGTKIPAILIGEEGRGRRLGVMPVHLPDPLYNEWREKGKVLVEAASIAQTKTGRPKLNVSTAPTDDDAIIAVLRTHIGYRGGNSHTGDRTGWSCPCGASGTDIEVPDKCPECGADKWAWRCPVPEFAPFPGKVLVEGVIAQGAAGRMGSGSQKIALMPKGAVFRTGYSGRLYGDPSAHYYLWNGEQLLAATWEERAVSDLF